MRMIPVASGRMSHIGYEGDTLRIRFMVGGTYDYFNVPDHEHAGLLRAPSLGRYFDAHIKGRYPTKKVTNG